jgi:exopolyphosphatase/guanosine-5'-triphosphate,3'-diphosphate pyrophosphatase
VIFFKPRAFDTVAAVDLGSNSFHMKIARLRDGGVDDIDRLREPVRLGAGLDAKGRLTDDAMKRALDCLQRFGQRLRDMPPGSVRAVGTNTLRKAKNAAGFIAAAEAALGHPIEIIAGVEEARLIYLGVAHDIGDDGQRRLVMDIGGGSTELIIGEHFEPLHMRSLHMGCVSMSQRFFGDGRITRKRWRRAETVALVELEPHEQQYRALGWSAAVGASGTIKAVGRVVRENGWDSHGITLAALEKLVDAMIDAGHIDNLKIAGVVDERRPVFAGGVAILKATFDALGIERMQLSESALREGLIHDLLGRIRHEDVRGRTVSLFMRRYECDAGQAQRVQETARSLYAQVRERWGLEAEEGEALLGWAADLHELGLQIARSGYHKHGAYIVDNADMPGFSREEQHLLSTLIRNHRRKLVPESLAALDAAERDTVTRLIILLRLAVLLHRSRSATPLPAIRLSADERCLTLHFEAGWLGAHPLTMADLEEEAINLSVIDYELEYE